MSNIKADKTIDCSGLSCPLPIAKTNRAIKDMAVGQILELISTDAGTMLDMQGWAKQTKHELLLVKDEGAYFRFFIKKTN